MNNNNNNNNTRIADVFEFISPILLTVFRSTSTNANYYYCVGWDNAFHRGRLIR